jgi:hypothetical protein
MTMPKKDQHLPILTGFNYSAMEIRFAAYIAGDEARRAINKTIEADTVLGIEKSSEPTPSPFKALFPHGMTTGRGYGSKDRS